MSGIPGLPDPALIVGNWTGEVAPQSEREALAYRETVRRLRTLHTRLSRLRKHWAARPTPALPHARSPISRRCKTSTRSSLTPRGPPRDERHEARPRHRTPGRDHRRPRRGPACGADGGGVVSGTRHRYVGPDDWGREERIVGALPMFHPGRCRWCGAIYDGGPVVVTARYADCSVWKAPCCGNTADDRPRGWGGSFFPLSNDERRRAGV